MGRHKGRAVDGILLLDKAPGLSSNAALQQVKRLFDARKAGHTGSLDVLATGLLPVCLGQATKVSAFLLDADKTYWVRAQLGTKTTTGDAEGEILAQGTPPALDAAQIQSALAGLHGEQEQVPPMYSAVKHHGRRLYELAREGVEVERVARRIRIHEFTLLERSERELVLRVRCSKGTYVRTLVETLAEALGTCGHVGALRREVVGPFHAQAMLTCVSLAAVAEQEGAGGLDRFLLPIEAALTDWPAMDMDPDSLFYLRRGQPVQLPRAPTSGWVRLHDPNGRLVAAGEVLEDGRIAPRRLF
ncbi:MAG: tRNA pseudouridine(55) synthase TruB [Salinisphaera sp.]|nr:tRNA pseudouridine(55) synthase TruB [Salinisphaera sp.]MDN5938049.1 tRNA pseudouridine(55) synthase TruB [Salinisphaera sp.]